MRDGFGRTAARSRTRRGDGAGGSSSTVLRAASRGLQVQRALPACCHRRASVASRVSHRVGRFASAFSGAFLGFLNLIGYSAALNGRLGRLGAASDSRGSRNTLLLLLRRATASLRLSAEARPVRGRPPSRRVRELPDPSSQSKQPARTTVNKPQEHDDHPVHTEPSTYEFGYSGPATALTL